MSNCEHKNWHSTGYVKYYVVWCDDCGKLLHIKKRVIRKTSRHRVFSPRIQVGQKTLDGPIPP